MDPGGLGAVIGLSLMGLVCLSCYIRDKCKTNEYSQTTNPLLVKKKSFKVKNLFQHVDF